MLKSNYLHNNTKTTTTIKTKSSPGLTTTTASNQNLCPPLQRLNSERLLAQEQRPSLQDLPLAREPQSTPDRVADDHDKEYDSDDDRNDDDDCNDDDDHNDDDDQEDHLCGGVKLRLPLSLTRLDTRLKTRFRFRKLSYKMMCQGAQGL